MQAQAVWAEGSLLTALWSLPHPGLRPQILGVWVPCLGCRALADQLTRRAWQVQPETRLFQAQRHSRPVSPPGLLSGPTQRALHPSRCPGSWGYTSAPSHLSALTARRGHPPSGTGRCTEMDLGGTLQAAGVPSSPTRDRRPRVSAPQSHEQSARAQALGRRPPDEWVQFSIIRTISQAH